MPPVRPRWFACLAIAIALVLPGAGAMAQDPVSEAFCALFSPQEMSEVLGADVVAEPGIESCSWVPTDGSLLLANVDWAEVTIDEHKASWPDGEDILIGGHTAYYSPGMFLNELLVELDDGVLWLVLTGFEGDVRAALTGLGELAVSRSGSLPPPPQPEPIAEMHADPALEAMFPTTIAGEPLSIVSVAGEEAVFESADRAAVADILAEQGKTYADLSGAFALVETGLIAAYRVAGADAATLVTPFIEAISGTASAMTPRQIAGRDVIEIAGTPLAYAYPVGDVLWIVGAEEPALSEILAALP